MHLVRTIPVPGPMPPGDDPPATLQGVGTRHDSYTIYYGFDQYLFHYGEGKHRGWGLFGRAAIGDDNPSPLGSFVSFGLGGDSPFARERGDTFGIGWYFAGTSSTVGPVQRLLLGKRDGNAVEIFYNFQVTPWLNVSPDIQYLTPNASRIANDSFTLRAAREYPILAQAQGSLSSLKNAIIGGLEDRQVKYLGSTHSEIKRCRIVKDVFRNTKEGYDDVAMELAGL